MLLTIGAAAWGVTACMPVPSVLELDPLSSLHGPVARVIVPQLWPVSVPVTIDGSRSEDEDGDSLRFVVQWGDGSAAVQDDDGIAQHSFPSAGTFALELLVEHATASSRVQAAIVIVDGEDSGCGCELGCVDDAVCTDRGCLLFRSAVAEPPPADAFEDAIDCL